MEAHDVGVPTHGDPLSPLQRLAAGLSESLTAAEFLQKAVEVTGATGGAVLRRDERHLTLVHAIGLPSAEVGPSRRLPLELAGPAAAVAQRCEPMFFESPADLVRAHPGLARAVPAEALHACALLPFGSCPPAFGVIALCYGEAHAFPVGERSALEALARVGAVALERARLFAAEREARAAAEASRVEQAALAEAALRRARRQTALADLARGALSWDVERLLEEAVRAMADHVGADIVSVFERVPGADALRLRAGCGLGAARAGFVCPAGESLGSLALRNGEQSFSDDIRTETRFRPLPVLLERGAVSGMATLIPGADGPLGVLGAHFVTRRARNDDDAQFVRGVAGVLGAALAREASDSALRRERDFTTTVLDTLGALVVVLDREGRAVRWNPAAERLTGYARREVLGRDVIELFVPADERDDVAALIAAVGRDGESRQYENDWITKSGERRRIAWSNGVIRNAAGEVEYFIGTGIDVTDRARWERELREADRQKDAFLAVLGHELRNPLAAIRGALQLRELAADDRATAQRVTSVLERQSLQMERLVDDLLDVSRIRSGKVELRHEPVDLGALARTAAGDRAREARERGLELVLDLPPDGVAWVRGDRARLVQILDNLLGNALRFTPRGRITVAVDAAQGEVRLRVRDTGVGIAPAVRRQIFEPFRQLAPSPDRLPERSGGGLGLGLAIVHGLVAMHGGAIDVHSEGPGKGTELMVTLPEGAPGAANERRRGWSLPGTRRFLVVDDNQDMADVLVRLLRIAGQEAQAAYSAREALDAARAQAPDVVLCDIGLPDGMTGHDVARALRSEPDTRAALLVALTGYGTAEDREEAVAAGFDAHLTKPVDLAAIEAVVAAGRP